MHKKFTALFILFLLTVSVPAQTAPAAPKPEDTAKLEKEAVEFLRETLVDVNNMRSLENRISFRSEMASLMWFKDEKEARVLYLGVTGDFKQLLAEFDSQMNAIAATASQDDEFIPGGMFMEISNKAQIQRKFATAMSLRQQIALSLAEHEPDMAMAFYYDSVALLSNPDFRGRTGDRDAGFEFQLMSLVAKTNAAKALEFGKKSLDKGVNYQHIELLKKIYAKDVDKGAEFAVAIISALKSSTSKSTEFWIYNSLLTYGGEIAAKVKKEGGKKPVMSESDLRDLAEAFAQKILNSDANDDSGSNFVDLIGKYSPSRAMQIKAKYKNRPVGNTSGYGSNSANAATNVSVSAQTGNYAVAGPNAADDRRAKAMEQREAEEKKLMEDVESLGTKKLGKEEREKIVTQSRTIIAKTPGKDKKIVALSMLAAQVAKAGDKELAAEIMKDAERLVNPMPKNYQDFLLSAMLASGYADVDAEKAFPLLTDTILRLNDTVSAFVKAAEFIDASGEIIDDGEIQVGLFGGSIIRELSGGLTIAEPTIRKLAIANFASKAAAGSFDRTEVRILAKMLVLRAILGNKEKKNADEDAIDAVTGVKKASTVK